MKNRCSLILATTVCFSLIACTPTDTVESSLLEIQSILTTANRSNDVHYELSFDSDYPCDIHLKESWRDTEYDWEQNYHFDLTNIQPDTFVQSKDGRRTIGYGGSKTTKDGGQKAFKEILINNIQYRASLNESDQVVVTKSMNRAIALCEEKYLFE